MSHSRLRDQQGVAFSEFIISVPFLLILLFGIVDLGIALNRYYTISRIAYEAVRYAAAIPQLETVTCDTLADTLGPPARKGHGLVRDRVNILLQRNDIGLAGLATDYLRTQRISAATLGAGYTRDQVVIRIEVPFLSIVPYWGNYLPKLHTEVSGPYLYTS